MPVSNQFFMAKKSLTVKVTSQVNCVVSRLYQLRDIAIVQIQIVTVIHVNIINVKPQL